MLQAGSQQWQQEATSKTSMDNPKADTEKNLANERSDTASADSTHARQIEEIFFQSLSTETNVEFLKISTEENIDKYLDECIAWVKADNSTNNPITLELYGTLVVWTPARMALVTSPRHFQKAESAVLEFTKTAFEMTAIEHLLSAAWEHYEDDLPSGFSFHKSDTSTVTTLSNRYVQAMSLSGKISRLSPRIHLPPEHPPTLAGQLGERLRDRSRLIDREEFADEQLNTIIRLYETTGQRVSEYTIAHREYILIWAIVLLLGAEILLLLTDLLSSAGN